MHTIVSDSGVHIAGYGIDTELAASSASRIFLGKKVADPTLQVIIKLFYPLTIDSQLLEERFLHEVQILKRLRHSSILPLLDANLAQGTPYLVLAYAPHGSLYDRLGKRASQPFSVDETLHVLSQIGEALQYAHQQQVVHGRIKPRNILFASEDKALLADFTPPILSTLPGGSIQNPDTAMYMAPEQFEDHHNPRSDQYALAYLAYTLLTGHTPSHLPTMSKSQRKTADGTLQHIQAQCSIDLPASIEHALLKASAADTAQRYPDVRVFLEALGVNLSGTAAKKPARYFPITGTLVPISSPAVYMPPRVAAPTQIPSTESQIFKAIQRKFADRLHMATPAPSPITELPVALPTRVSSYPLQAANHTPPLLNEAKQQKKFHPRSTSSQLLIGILVLIIGIMGSILAIFQPQYGLNSHEPRSYAYMLRAGTAGAITAQNSTATTTSMQTPFPTGTSEVPSQPTATSTITLGTSVRHVPSDAVLTPSASNTRANSVLTVSPAQLSPANCPLAGNAYRCTVTLTLNQQLQNITQWAISSKGASARFLPANSGFLVPAQATQIIILLPLNCPRAGVIIISARKTSVTLPWNCYTSSDW